MYKNVSRTDSSHRNEEYDGLGGQTEDLYSMPTRNNLCLKRPAPKNVTNAKKFKKLAPHNNNNKKIIDFINLTE